MEDGEDELLPVKEAVGDELGGSEGDGAGGVLKESSQHSTKILGVGRRLLVSPSQPLQLAHQGSNSEWTESGDSMEDHAPRLKTFQAHRSSLVRPLPHPMRLTPNHRPPSSISPPSLILARLEASQQSLTMMGRVHRFLTDGEKSLCKMEQTSICWREAGDPANERGRERAAGGGKGLAG